METRQVSERLSIGRRRWIGTTTLLGAFALAVTSCGSSPTKAAQSPVGHKIDPTATTTIPQITSSSVVINGQSVAVPTEEGSKPIGQAVATGQQIILGAHGALPAQLFAASSTPVVWTNLTSEPITLTVNHVGLGPQSIAPGRSYSWTPNVLDFSFSASNGAKGVVNVAAFTR